MSDLVVAIDAGTTGVTVLVIDGSTEVRGRAYSEFGQHYPRPGWVEHDASEIWDVTSRLLTGALKDAGASASDLAAIGITNQRETAVVWDRNSGDPIAPAVVWQCRRTSDLCERIKEDDELERELQSRTGLVVDPYFSATKIQWYLEEIDGARERAEAGDLAFGTIDSWLVWNMTQGEEHVTEHSNASRTMLYSLERQGWDGWILEALGIPDSLLPDIEPSSGRFGEMQIDGVSVPISGVAGDQQAALYGQACFDVGMAKNTYGTGSFVLMNTGSEVRKSEHGLLSSAAWDVGEGVRFVLEGSIFITGAAIQWMRDGLGLIKDAADTGPLAASVPDANGLYLVPAFVGLGAPHWDSYARGALLGITQGSSRAHVARAAVEAMAYQTRDVVEAMQHDSGTSLAELRVDGGASVMDVLCQFQADQLGVPVRRPANRETTAMGAAFLAGLAEGVWPSQDDIQDTWTADAEFEPKTDRAAADDAYEGWKRAVERAKAWA